MASSQRVFLLTVLTFLFIVIVVPFHNVDGGTFTVFGPKDYSRAPGEPLTETDPFSVFNPNTSYTIQIHNGGDSGQFQKRVSSGVIKLNDSLIIGPEDFSQNMGFLERPVILTYENELSIELRSAPGSGLTVEIIGVDNDPPLISADIIPPPNAYGWNNADVTVEFTCSDIISGVASCTGPVLVEMEDSAQVISGTAVDYAGNTASTSVSVNLDKTSPLVTIDYPSPMFPVSFLSSINVRGTVVDTLSGNYLLFLNGDSLSWSNEDTLNWEPDSFSTYMPLDPGWNSVDVTAADVAGNVGNAFAEVNYFPVLVDTVDFELVEKFAPQLRFSSKFWGDWWSDDNYPMSAQRYYDNVVARGNPPEVKWYNMNPASVTNHQVPTYWTACVCRTQVRIIYAWFWGYQFTGDGFKGDHNGDWEHIMVTLSEDKTRVAAVTFWQHAGWYTRLAARNGFALFEGTHPVVYPGRCQHGSFDNTQTAAQTCIYWEDYRDGAGPWLNSWVGADSTLIELRPSSEGGEPWMDADLVGGFTWGYRGVSTHPTTQYVPACYLLSCEGDPGNLFGTNGCARSQCEATDRDATWTCWHCAPGWVDWGAFCVRKCWAYPFCGSHSIKVYGIDWPIPDCDAGLLYKAGW
jgi:hypothetical protein